MDISGVAGYLQEVLGQKLVAYMAAVRDPKGVGQWARGAQVPRLEAERRLRAAYQAVQPVEGARSRRSSGANRFDARSYDYGVLYFGSTLQACFAETLARLRPSVKLLALVEDEWRRAGFMDAGSVPADWRQRLTAVHRTESLRSISCSRSLFCLRAVACPSPELCSPKRSHRSFASRQRLGPTRFSFCRDARGRGLAMCRTGHSPKGDRLLP